MKRGEMKLLGQNSHKWDQENRFSVVTRGNISTPKIGPAVLSSRFPTLRSKDVYFQKPTFLFHVFGRKSALLIPFLRILASKLHFFAFHASPNNFCALTQFRKFGELSNQIIGQLAEHRRKTFLREELFPVTRENISTLEIGPAVLSSMFPTLRS